MSKNLGLEQRKKLPVEPYKGVRDFYPEDQAFLNYLLATYRGVAERFGYVEYHASILEPAELYKNKGADNEEIISEQTYTFVDPMAEGVLLCLVGEANKRREAYLDLNKEYVLDVLFGFSTDTYDILGRVMEVGFTEQGDGSLALTRKEIERALNEFRGKIAQEYPPFSSKTVEGKSLFEWARAGALSSLLMPSRSVTIYDLVVEKMYKVPEAMLLTYIEQSVEKVQGDFRQEEILRIWRRHLKKDGDREFRAATIGISCSSGTYARSIAHGLGKHLGIPALALRILRTKVGDYSVDKSLK